MAGADTHTHGGCWSGSCVARAARGTIDRPGRRPAIPDYLSFILRNITIRGIANGNRAMMVDLLRAVEANGIKTVVSKTFAFDDAPQAYAYFAQADHIGKVMITF